MNKSDRINDFFDFFKQLKRENPDKYFYENEVYKILTRFYVTDDKRNLLASDDNFDQKLKKRGMFARWVDRFMYHENTRAFVSPGWQYFCQFVAGDLRHNNDGEYIKIYIPLDIKHIEIGANRLFEFINSMAISHVSKISADVRFDDIVVRVGSKEDADAIINFVKNDKYIQKGLYKPNPFAFNKDGLALACDGDESFNSILSGLITHFINNTDKEHLNETNFYAYLQKLYTSFYNGEMDIDRFIAVTYHSRKPNIKDFKRVFELIIKSHNNNFTYDDFINHFKEGLNSYQQQQHNNDLEYEIYMIIKELNTKYSLNDSIKRLCAYIAFNEPQYITRTNDLRNRVISMDLRSKVLMQLNGRKDIKISDYLIEILNKYENSYSHKM